MVAGCAAQIRRGAKIGATNKTLLSALTRSALGSAVRLVLFPQHLLVKFAHACLGNGFHKNDIIRQPPLRYARAQVFYNLILAELSRKIGFRARAGRGTSLQV